MRRGPLLGLVALLHLLIGLRLLAPLPTPAAWACGLALAGLYTLLVSSLTPIFQARMDRPWLVWSGLVAMGFFSSLLVLTVLREGLLLVAWLAGWQVEAASAMAVPALAALASLWGLVNARRRPAVREVTVPIEGLPPALEGFSIVQITDLHVGVTIQRAFVQRVVDTANALQPDVIAVTGDSVDGQVEQLRTHIAPLAGLRARHGVFAVTGNHEYYSGAPAWIAEYRRLGMRVLLNEHVVLDHDGAPLLLAGVTDYTAGHFDAAQASDATRALQGAPSGLRPRVLLAHQPRSAPAAAQAGFDVQLSGHTHGGQFLPWRWFVPLQQPYTAGLHRLQQLWVYTSRGTGYWGPPKRLGAPSEITRVRLVAAPR
ncbi:metallophosphoesterase [Ideonella sp. BN130291]|uniref:metallophosphoesterase n=1 Tax=Ideonella sp. BN130291 TaxID=3112940 RepID=UPI002E25B479|nr:metallophosphoesterase [Ideonella sp. BN130291]